MHLQARTHAVQVLCHLRRRRSCVNCAVGRLRTSTIKQKMLLNRRPRTLFKPIKSLLNEPVYANCVYNLFNTLFHFRVSLLNCSANSVNNSPRHQHTKIIESSLQRVLGDTANDVNTCPFMDILSMAHKCAASLVWPYALQVRTSSVPSPMCSSLDD